MKKDLTTAAGVKAWAYNTRHPIKGTMKSGPGFDDVAACLARAVRITQQVDQWTYKNGIAFVFCNRYVWISPGSSRRELPDMTRIPRPTTIYLAAATAAAAMHCVGQYVIGLDGWSIVYGVFIGMVFNIAMARWLSP